MRLFLGLSCRDNLLLALTPPADEGIVPIRRLAGARGGEAARRQRADQLLAHVGLAHAADTLAGDLSYAEQKLKAAEAAAAAAAKDVDARRAEMVTVEKDVAAARTRRVR